jgi:hypothetical protein
MKSVGPKGLLKSHKSKELINCQIHSLLDKNIDINVVLGFGADKIRKKISDNIPVIRNDLYELYNQGYAFELILNEYNYHKYDGCLLINDGVLLNYDIKNQILKSNLSESKIFYITSKKISQFKIGFTTNPLSKVEHMFFNLGDNLWGEVLYLDNHTMIKYKNLYKASMRNMFLFELINKGIDLGISYTPIKLFSKDIVKISSIKDSNKIKGTV